MPYQQPPEDLQRWMRQQQAQRQPQWSQMPQQPPPMTQGPWQDMSPPPPAMTQQGQNYRDMPSPPPPMTQGMGQMPQTPDVGAYLRSTNKPSEKEKGILQQDWRDMYDGYENPQKLTPERRAELKQRIMDMYKRFHAADAMTGE